MKKKLCSFLNKLNFAKLIAKKINNNNFGNWAQAYLVAQM